MATLQNVTINDTGYAQLPTGSTAQRPASPVVGMIRFNTDTRVVECYTTAGWQAYDDQQTATGGTISSAGGYTIHTFTSGGTFTPTYTGPVDVLVVAGGGSGAAGIGGGGGGGGTIYSQGMIVTSGTAYPITIGTGGPAPGTGHGPDGSKGNPSVALGITSTGGGGGSGYYAGYQNSGTIGGSGGGGSGYGQPTGPWGGNSGIRPSPPGISGQGFPGGYGVHWPGTPAGSHYGGGGGGGAGQPGHNCLGFPNWQGNDGTGNWAPQNESFLNGTRSGGNGLASSISGSATYYAGGGAGGMHGNGNALYPAQGGLGGGGSSSGPGPANGSGGTFYGGGGGGGTHPDPSSGGAGYQGVVIIRYKQS